MKKIFKHFWVTQGCQETPQIQGSLSFSGGSPGINYFETPYKFSAQNATKEIRKQFQRLPPSLHSINQRLIQQKGSKRVKKERKENRRLLYPEKKLWRQLSVSKHKLLLMKLALGKKDFIDSTQCIQRWQHLDKDIELRGKKSRAKYTIAIL